MATQKILTLDMLNLYTSLLKEKDKENIKRISLSSDGKKIYFYCEESSSPPDFEVSFPVTHLDSDGTLSNTD